MTLRVRIVNTAPLIFLAKLGQLDLLHLGVDVVFVPTIVLNELNATPDETIPVVQALLNTWLFERNCTRPDLLTLANQALDAGEAAVIALALELETRSVVLDDLDARRFAHRSGLTPIGTLGLLLAAKASGLIPAVSPEIEKLRQAGFHASYELEKRILFEAGE